MTKTTPPSPRYRFADHVRACHVDGQVILLDLQRGKYIGVGGSMLHQISEHVVDWPAGAAVDVTHAQPAAVSSWIKQLHQQNLLVDASTAPLARVEVCTPLQTMSDATGIAQVGLRWRSLGRLIGSAICAARWLRRDSLSTIAGKVNHMRPGARTPADSACSDELADAVASYHRMRPLIMTSHDKCLHDSLTLLRYLAAHNMYPRWVVGVRIRPFAAHSWVQAGDTVLNDLHERVRGFTPILVV